MRNEFLGCFPERKADSSPTEVEGHIKPSGWMPRVSFKPRTGLGKRNNKNVGCFPGMRSWQFSLEPPVLHCECTDTSNDEDGDGGDGGRDEDGATFHLFGAAFLNPGCTLGPPQAFLLKHLIRTPPQSNAFRPVTVRLAPALVF